jgi:hypothetical protein
MGLEASLKLLDLSPDATIDDANQAYTHLHHMVDRYHRENGAGRQGSRQEDMSLLSRAYEKAVAYLSTAGPGQEASADHAQPGATASESPAATNLHFTINFTGDTDEDAVADTAALLTAHDRQTIQEAMAIIARRLQETEGALPAAQQAVEKATTDLETVNRRCEIARQTRLKAVVAAKSAKARALLLEIEAKRAMEDAAVVAKKAQARVAAANEAAKEARVDADNARAQAGRIKKSEETIAAEAVCAEDRLEKAKVRLKTLTHSLVEARHQMKMFTKTEGDEIKTVDANRRSEVRRPQERICASRANDHETPDRRQLMADLLEIEAALEAKKRKTALPETAVAVSAGVPGPGTEGRPDQRLVYSPGMGPMFSIDNRLIPVLGLGSAGMRLEPDDALARMRIVRGVIAFAEQPPIKVAGKVVRQDESGLELRLVTRIGNRILDKERSRLNT